MHVVHCIVLRWCYVLVARIILLFLWITHEFTLCNDIIAYFAAISNLTSNRCTVPLKCKLTVSTRNSILDPEVFENRVSIFEVREPSFEDWVSSFETLEEFFEDLEKRFQGNDLILENKTIAMNKGIDMQLYSRKLTLLWMFANIFSCCAFSTRHMWFAYLHWSWWQQTSLASKCVYNVSCRNEWLFLRDYNPERVCCFHLGDFNWPLKT